MDKAQAAKRIRNLRDEIKAHQVEITELVAEHFSSLNVGESLAAGRYIVQATPNVRFDPALAAKVLTPEEFSAILESVPSSKKAKEMLSPARYAETQKKFQPTIGVVDMEEE